MTSIPEIKALQITFETEKDKSGITTGRYTITSPYTSTSFIIDRNKIDRISYGFSRVGNRDYHGFLGIKTPKLCRDDIPIGVYKEIHSPSQEYLIVNYTQGENKKQVCRHGEVNVYSMSENELLRREIYENGVLQRVTFYFRPGVIERQYNYKDGYIREIELLYEEDEYGHFEFNKEGEFDGIIYLYHLNTLNAPNEGDLTSFTMRKGKYSGPFRTENIEGTFKGIDNENGVGPGIINNTLNMLDQLDPPEYAIGKFRRHNDRGQLEMEAFLDENGYHGVYRSYYYKFNDGKRENNFQNAKNLCNRNIGKGVCFEFDDKFLSERYFISGREVTQSKYLTFFRKILDELNEVIPIKELVGVVNEYTGGEDSIQKLVDFYNIMFPSNVLDLISEYYSENNRKTFEVLASL